MVFRCPNIQPHYNETVNYLNFGTPKNNEFSIWNKWKNLLFLGVPVLKHIRVRCLNWTIIVVLDQTLIIRSNLIKIISISNAKGHISRHMFHEWIVSIYSTYFGSLNLPQCA